MTYFKIEAEGASKADLTKRETLIIQNALLNLAAMTNALLVGKGVYLNPPDEGKLGITLSYPEALDKEKEAEVIEVLLKKFDTFFSMSELQLTASMVSEKAPR